MTEVNGTSSEKPLMSGVTNQRVDDKSRWIVPIELREPLGTNFTLTVDSDNNMAVFPGPFWKTLRESMVEQLRSPELDDHDIAAIGRTLTFAVDINATTNGYRVPIPEPIRDVAQLKKDIVTVGNLDHVVVWDKEKFITTTKERYSHPEVLRRQRLLLRGVPLHEAKHAGTGDANGNAAPSHPGDGG